ncbi:MAG: exodeoxyribonuclease VII small subunit [Planctomycetes bacterium]|nr:exodeoxyribonuclease VII small subunit [Planctomycetota bacterium]
MKKERFSPIETTARKESGQKFEEYLLQAEKIVAGLEEGNLDLEESLCHYEEGIKALKKCYEILNGIEKRIEILIKDEKGNFQCKPFKKSNDNE